MGKIGRNPKTGGALRPVAPKPTKKTDLSCE